MFVLPCASGKQTKLFVCLLPFQHVEGCPEAEGLRTLQNVGGWCLWSSSKSVSLDHLSLTVPGEGTEH